jgi:septal ring-binding cell division protein DamX
VAKGTAAAGDSPEFAILPFDLKGRACYLVVWGHYPDRAGAEAAMKALPAFFLQAAQPKVVPKAKVLELSGVKP